MRYQQNLTGRKLAFVVIGNQQWPILRRYVDRVVDAVNAATPGSFTLRPQQVRFATRGYRGATKVTCVSSIDSLPALRGEVPG